MTSFYSYSAMLERQRRPMILLGVALRSTDVVALRSALLAAVLGLLASYSKSLANESGISANWRYVRVCGRTLRVLILGIGLVLTGLSHVYVGVLATLVVLALFNAASFGERLIRVAASE